MKEPAAVALSSLNLPFAEALHAEYLKDPTSVPPDWRELFASLGDGAVAAVRGAPALRRRGGLQPPPAPPAPHLGQDTRMAVLQDRVDQLVRAYRTRGHLAAAVDPLGIKRPDLPELDPASYGFTRSDMELPFSAATMHGSPVRTLAEMVERLRETYCRSIGVEYMHIDDQRVRSWLQERMEGTGNHLALERAEQLRILGRLTDSAIFEAFLQKKYTGAKTFSLEGAESLIPLLDLAIEKAGEHGVEEIVLAMAHRGRLNVLANIIGKRPRDIFREFEDPDPELHRGGGDVKHHLGHASDWVTSSGKKVHLSLCFNPSHLEFVNPVALGRLRAKQDRVGDRERARGMALLIHGDAGLAGEGIAQETLNLSGLAAYATGGALHVVVNNQIGFTTPPGEGRSSVYATDVAKMLQVPIFHVNGEDPEAVAMVVGLAMDFRRTFRADVFVDMYCYRLHGHSEGDEPSFTQPRLYEVIRSRQSVRDAYLEHLLELGGVTSEEARWMEERKREELEAELEAARHPAYEPPSTGRRGVWKGYLGGPEADVPEPATAVEEQRLVGLLEALSRVPEGFTVHRRLGRWLGARGAMARGERALDWAAGEAVAVATLAAEGYRVRLTGQDTARGTFSQRHAVLHDVRTGEQWMPLAHLEEGQAPVEVRNSPLSEAGVLGFEYGYSLDWPDGLVMWEAQFGDFCNAAQVIIDQFLVSAEEKWRRLSGLVLLLPHGFEGMGPEHSSARLERFLALAAEENLQVVQPTTPAQFFHCLRRQVLRPWRKPLVAMTPKSLLRHPRVVSPLAEFAAGRFHRILADEGIKPATAERVVLCSGKVFYELLERREKEERKDTALLRIEQLYPLPERMVEEALAPYEEGIPAVWVQEEPENMGAWRFLRAAFGEKLLSRHPFSCVARPASASPATGSASSHRLEQRELLDRVFS